MSPAILIPWVLPDHAQPALKTIVQAIHPDVSVMPVLELIILVVVIVWLVQLVVLLVQALLFVVPVIPALTLWMVILAAQYRQYPLV